jgi:hypothetical protein
MHEDFSREERIAASSDRAFGIVVGTLVALLSLLPLLFSAAGNFKWWWFAIGAILVVLALFWPAALRPLNKAWLRLGLLLFKLVNPIVLALIFFLCVAPIGLLMRLTGKDVLGLGIKRLARSYWITRETAPGSMKNQF